MHHTGFGFHFPVCFSSVEAFENVFGKLPMIYNLILRNLGENDLVETNRGKKGVADTVGDVNEEEFHAQPPLSFLGTMLRKRRRLVVATMAAAMEPAMCQ